MSRASESGSRGSRRAAPRLFELSDRAGAPRPRRSPPAKVQCKHMGGLTLAAQEENASAFARPPGQADNSAIFEPMSIRIEQYDGGEVLYIAFDPDGKWAKSEFPDELLTVDLNAQGGVIGVEAIGSLAQAGADAVMIRALVDNEGLENPAAVKQTLEPVVA